jgi:hypothetical protein
VHAATDRSSDPFGHDRQREAPIEAEASPFKVSPVVLLKIEGVDHTALAGYEIVQQSIDQAELRQIDGVLTAGDYGLMAIACRDDVAEASKAIREHGTA